MQLLWKRWQDPGESWLDQWWAVRREGLMRAAVLLMAIAAVIWLGYEFWRLLFQPGRMGAIDLKYYHDWTHRWFQGGTVFDGPFPAEYPPASYALLWPFVGWVEIEPARWLWAAWTAGALGWLARLILAESGAGSRLERAFVVLMLLAIYPTGATIGNGQTIILILPPLATALLALSRGDSDWRRDILAAALLLFALAKPSISGPFMWLALFLPGRLRPILLLSSGYLALTVFAASYQNAPFWSLLAVSLANGADIAVTGGNADVHLWLATLGLKEWMLPASLFLFAALGAWTFRFRRTDVWILLGVSALVARFWCYHRWYDDLLILLPMIALFRIAKRAPSNDGSGRRAGLLLVLVLLTMVAPGGLYLLPPPLNTLYLTVQVSIFLTVLLFLLWQAPRFERHPEPELRSGIAAAR
jgi:hypothetical protein